MKRNYNAVAATERSNADKVAIRALDERRRADTENGVAFG